jgi:hypothetical protein
LKRRENRAFLFLVERNQSLGVRQEIEISSKAFVFLIFSDKKVKKLFFFFLNKKHKREKIASSFPIRTISSWLKQRNKWSPTPFSCCCYFTPRRTPPGSVVPPPSFPLRAFRSNG